MNFNLPDILEISYKLLKESCRNARKKCNVDSELKIFTFYSIVSRYLIYSASFQTIFFSNQYTITPKKEASLTSAHLYIFTQ